jgi:hypothetical protein
MSETMWIVIGIVSTLAIMKRKLKLRGMIIIKIQEHLNGKWKECFEGMDISYEGNKTIFTGILKDEAHMHKVLNIIRDYNLILISINPEERFHIVSSIFSNLKLKK